MRACGIELAASEQIEQVAEAILSASALHDPTNHRARKLAEVLPYLERRIDRMFDSAILASREPPVEPVETIEEDAPPAGAAPKPGLAMMQQSETDALAVAESNEAVTPAHAGETLPNAQAPSMWERPVCNRAQPEANEDPADFLLEPLSMPRAESGLSRVLTAIESELFGGDVNASAEPMPAALSFAAVPAAPAANASFPTGSGAVPHASAAANPTPRRVAGDPLAALTALSDEERIALFT
jgi:hypothetical protein